MPAYTNASPQVVWQKKRKISPPGLVPRRRRGWRYGVFRDTRNIGWTTSRWGWSACLKKRQTFSKSTLRLPPDLSHFKSCCAKISDFNYQKSHKTTFEKLTDSHRAQCARWSILISSLVILINYSFFEKNTRCNSEFDAVNWIVWLLKKGRCLRKLLDELCLPQFTPNEEQYLQKLNGSWKLQQKLWIFFKARKTLD
jgi:hypothetical protein